MATENSKAQPALIGSTRKQDHPHSCGFVAIRGRRVDEGFLPAATRTDVPSARGMKVQARRRLRFGPHMGTDPVNRRR